MGFLSHVPQRTQRPIVWFMAKGHNPKHQLYDPASRKFFVRNGEWTPDKSRATTFGDLASLIQLCLRYGLKDAQLLVQTGPGRRVRLPICG